MRVKRATVGAIVDMSTHVDLGTAKLFKASGVSIVMRYVRRDKRVLDKPDGDWPESLSKLELDWLLEAGLEVGLFQFARFHGGNYLSATSGAAVGEAAAWNVAALGIPEGMTTFVDAEWTDAPESRVKRYWYNRRVKAYLRAWGKRYAAGGGSPGCYEAYEGLSGRQWYKLPPFRHYYCSAMKAPRMIGDPQPRGFCAWQGLEHSRSKAGRGRPPVFGQAIDTGQSHYDRKGDRFYVVTA